MGMPGIESDKALNVIEIGFSFNIYAFTQFIK